MSKLRSLKAERSSETATDKGLHQKVPLSKCRWVLALGNLLNYLLGDSSLSTRIGHFKTKLSESGRTKSEFFEPELRRLYLPPQWEVNFRVLNEKRLLPWKSVKSTPRQNLCLDWLFWQNDEESKVARVSDMALVSSHQAASSFFDASSCDLVAKSSGVDGNTVVVHSSIISDQTSKHQHKLLHVIFTLN